jgi:hypothetical protein
MPRAPVSFAPALARYTSRFDGVAEQLVQDYGFNASFALTDDEEKRTLREHLDTAGGMYLAARRRFPTARERRERLALMEREARAVQSGRRDRAEALAQLLLSSPSDFPTLPERLEHRFDHDADGKTVAVLPIEFQRKEVDDILAQLAAMKPWLAKARPPVSGDAALRMLVRALAAIWRAGTLRHATISTDDSRDYKKRRGGPYLEFLQIITGHLGIRTTAEALAKLHERYGK